MECGETSKEAAATTSTNEAAPVEPSKGNPSSFYEAPR